LHRFGTPPKKGGERNRREDSTGGSYIPGTERGRRKAREKNGGVHSRRYNFCENSAAKASGGENAEEGI